MSKKSFLVLSMLAVLGIIAATAGCSSSPASSTSSSSKNSAAASSANSSVAAGGLIVPDSISALQGNASTYWLQITNSGSPNVSQTNVLTISNSYGMPASTVGATKGTILTNSANTFISKTASIIPSG